MIWSGRGFTFDLDQRTIVMGILNVTPDSFSDGDRFFDQQLAVEHALQMAEEGADILDIGGESSRPGAKPVNADEELSRVLPVIKAVCASSDVPISIDTSKPEVAKEALAAGAVIINDVTALSASGMAEMAATSDAGLVLMHMKGEPRTMQQNPQYDDLLGEIGLFLQKSAGKALAAGVKKERIVIDPGVGFGKTLDHNLQLIRHLRSFADLGYPVLVGPSRKRFIGDLTGKDINERLYGTIAAVVAAVMAGARIVRVHDVAPVVDALRVAEAIAGTS